MKKLLAGVLVFSTLWGAAALNAQEGHPVKGSWIGVWDSEAHGRSLLMIMDWNGESITGIINPGTDNIEITEASLDPEDWVLSIKTDHREEGERYSYRLEGSIRNIEQANRAITGTWSNGSDSGTFELARQ